MADLKISQLPAATTPLAGTEVLPIVQSSTTDKVAVSDLTAGRAVSAASLTLTTTPLAATSGGTGSASAFTANGIVYAASSTSVTTSSGLTWSGTTLTSNSSLGSGSNSGFAATNIMSATAVLPTGFVSNTSIAASVATGDFANFYSNSGALGAGASITREYGFLTSASIIRGTTSFGFHAADTAALTTGKTNYGYYSAINTASGGGTTWAFYGAGTAQSFFAGDMQFDKTVTGGTGGQTINKNAGTVNFAAAATAITVTNSRVTANSIIICTLGTVDTTAKSAAAVAGSGSFVITLNAAATGTTRCNFIVIN